VKGVHTKEKNQYFVDLLVVPNLFGTRIFQPNKFGCYQGHKVPFLQRGFLGIL